MATFQSTTSETMNLPGAGRHMAAVLSSVKDTRTSYAKTRSLGGNGNWLGAGGHSLRGCEDCGIANRGFRGLGDVGDNGDNDTVTIGARDFQRKLIAAGYRVGNTGADDVFGPATLSALQKFVNAKMPGVSYSARGVTGNIHGVVLTPKSVWTGLQLAAQTVGTIRQASNTVHHASTGSGSLATNTTVIPNAPPDVQADMIDPNGGIGWVGVGLAALGILGVGGAIYFSTRKKRR